METRTRRLFVSAALVGSLVAAGCTQSPSGDGPIPSCPACQEVSVEQSATQDYSQVRAVSDNGQWVVSSRTIAGEYELTVRHVGDPAGSAVVGQLPYESVDTSPLVAVTDDGSTVLYSLEWTTPLRWHRATGTSDELAIPVPTGWPGGYSNWGVRLTGFSSDGSRAFWNASRSDGSGGNNERLMTDTTSGEIVHEHSFVLDYANANQRPLASSPDGRFYVEDGILVDTLTSQDRVLSAVDAYFGDTQLTVTPLTVSQNGRFIVYLTSQVHDVYEQYGYLYLWDTEHDTGVLVDTTSPDSNEMNHIDPFDVAGVGDDGRLVYARFANLGIEIVDRSGDGRSTLVGQYLENQSFRTFDFWNHLYLVGTPDLRSVVLSRRLPPTDQSRLTVLRCT